MSDRGMYFDRQGRPMEMLAWSGKFSDREYQIVARHWVRGWMISTVWTGIDHGFGFTEAPVIFETMIFPPADVAVPGGESMWGEQYMDRYATEAAAQAGHDRAIAWLGERLGTDVMADLSGPLVPGSGDEQWDGTIAGLS